MDGKGNAESATRTMSVQKRRGTHRYSYMGEPRASARLLRVVTVWCCEAVLMALLLRPHPAAALEFPVEGSVECPCIMDPGLSFRNDLLNALDTALDPVSYGIGCGVHDERTNLCSGAQPNVPLGPECDNVMPLPASCEPPNLPFWCNAAWCYVEQSCGLKRWASTVMPSRFYRCARSLML